MTTCDENYLKNLAAVRNLIGEPPTVTVTSKTWPVSRDTRRSLRRQGWHFHCGGGQLTMTWPPPQPLPTPRQVHGLVWDANGLSLALEDGRPELANPVLLGILRTRIADADRWGWGHFITDLSMCGPDEAAVLRRDGYTVRHPLTQAVAIGWHNPQEGTSHVAP